MSFVSRTRYTGIQLFVLDAFHQLVGWFFFDDSHYDGGRAVRFVHQRPLTGLERLVEASSKVRRVGPGEWCGPSDWP
jgi:hypothetical protein